MKRIGLRTIKTAISVFLCLMVYILLKLCELIPFVPTDFAYTWYNPFFAGIATAYSVHASKGASFNQAKNRCVASLIGGGIGIILITIYELCGGCWPNLQSVSLQSFNFVLPYLLISLCTILVVVVGIMLKQPQAIFVAILTFLSVTVNPNINVSHWQWQFGLNRILSTIIGVLIALGVNLFRVPHFNKNQNLLFAVGIDGMLKEKERIRGFMQYKLNYLAEIKANVTLFTTRTPTTFMDLLDDVKISHPVVCMSGAALYDTKELRYVGLENIDEDTALIVRNLLKENHISPFINVVKDNVLYSYNENIDNDGERRYFDSNKNAAYSCLICGEAPKGEVLYFLMIEKEERIASLLKLLDEQDELKDKLSVLIYDYFDENQDSGLKYVKLYSKKIEQLNLVKKYCEEKALDLVGLTSSGFSNHLLENSKMGITLSSAPISTQKVASRVINSKEVDVLLKEVQKIYYCNLDKVVKKENIVV